MSTTSLKSPFSVLLRWKHQVFTPHLCKFDAEQQLASKAWAHALNSDFKWAQKLSSASVKLGT